MPQWIDEQHNVERLIETLQSRWPIVLFVGAGVSVQMGYPGWSDFLLSTAPDNLRPTIEHMIRHGKFEEAAESIFERRKVSFEDAIKDEFCHRRSLTSASVAFCLPRLVDGPVVTTNFDTVLERVFSQVGRPFEVVALGAQGEGALEAFETNSRSLIKLHGHASNNDTRILTQEEYRTHYCRDRTNAIDYKKPLPRALKTLMSKATFLFVGCSLKQDKYLTVLKAAVKDTNARHYAVLSEPEAAGRDQRTTELRASNIHPIWYRPGRHRDIRTLIEHVADGVHRNIITPFCPAHVREKGLIRGRLAVHLDSEDVDFLDIVKRESQAGGELEELFGTVFAALAPGFVGDRARIFSATRNADREIILSFFPHAFDDRDHTVPSIRLSALQNNSLTYWPRRRGLTPQIEISQEPSMRETLVLTGQDENHPCRIMIEFK